VQHALPNDNAVHKSSKKVMVKHLIPAIAAAAAK